LKTVLTLRLNTLLWSRKVTVKWPRSRIENTGSACILCKRLGITLDRSLTHRNHCENSKKISITRNGLLWESDGEPSRIRQEQLPFRFFTGEYASPARGRSTRSEKIDVALDERSHEVEEIHWHRTVDNQKVSANRLGENGNSERQCIRRVH